MFKIDLADLRRQAERIRTVDPGCMANAAKAANASADLEHSAPLVAGLANLAGLAVSHEPEAVEPVTEPRPDWRVLDKAYQAHHWNCPACIAAGRLRDGTRCPVGLVLWQAYEEAAQ